MYPPSSLDSYGKEAIYIAVGDGVEEEIAAKSRNMPFQHVAKASDLNAAVQQLRNLVRARVPAATTATTTTAATASSSGASSSNTSGTDAGKATATAATATAGAGAGATAAHAGLKTTAVGTTTASGRSVNDARLGSATSLVYQKKHKPKDAKE